MEEEFLKSQPFFCLCSARLRVIGRQIDFTKFITRDLLTVSVCVCVCVLALVQMWLAPTSPHPLGYLPPHHPPPVSACNSSIGLSHGDKECAQWLQETPGLLLWLSPHPPSFPSSRDFRQPVAGDSATPNPTPATQPPGQASGSDLPRQAEAGCGAWGNGWEERLPPYKPHPLLQAPSMGPSAKG